MWVHSLGWEDLLEEGMATHCSIFAWRIPWTEEPGGLQSIRSQSRTRLKLLIMHAFVSRAGPGRTGVLTLASGLPRPGPTSSPPPYLPILGFYSGYQCRAAKTEARKGSLSCLLAAGSEEHL